MLRRLTGLSIVISVLAILLLSASAGAEVIVQEYEPGQLLKETDFDEGSGLPWHICESAPAKADFWLEDGKYFVEIIETNPSGDIWDLQFRHRDLFLESGHNYEVEFTVTASENCEIYAKIGDQGDPYTEDWNNNWSNHTLQANQTYTFKDTFTSNRSAKVLEFAFHLANAPEGTVFEFDDMSLYDPQFEGHEPEVRPDYREIRVNQLGYFPNRKKLATLHTEANSAVEWWLEDSNGNEVMSGMTEPFGEDNDSGENVHIIDFSDFDEEGRDYKLYADSDPVYDGSDNQADSYPFDIATDMYDELVYDSLKYFYQSRSGEPILEEHVADLEQKQLEIERRLGNIGPNETLPPLSREAGHTEDIATTSVEEPDEDWYFEHSSYEVDITGGWYDAGDHGKYVVNGGITLWTLQNMYERTLYRDDEDPDAFGDNTMDIPESGNGIPDILDETKVHMDVMLQMQVEEGKDRAGMAFHKGHDSKWTGLAITPAEATELVDGGGDSEIERIVKPPTTAATLNLAATAAQAYRLWEDHDSSYADKCLAAAERAWEAALDNPEIYAPFDDSRGGGPYGDDYVEDDFYWAAAELFIATGDSEYLDFMEDSPHYLEVPNYLTAGEESDTVGQFNWGNTAALGTLSLALVPNDLSQSDLETARENIAKAGDFNISIQESQGYGIPIETCTIGIGDEPITGYPWGSNSFVNNIAIVLAYAYDYTGEAKYLDGATEAYDYLMGRNPNERAYVTGYGDYPVEFPHHRFFSNQVDDSFAKAPPGIMVGGPNSGLQDPWVKGSGWGAGEKAPQKSYMDHIESWSTNECTINWNAPTAWMTAFLSENGNEEGGESDDGNDDGNDDDKNLGDVDGDGMISSLDYAALRKENTGQTVSNFIFDNADIDEDGSITSLDTVMLRQYLTGARTF
ncbi:MAG: glycoside hydrolase family 9 protein [Bacillota bacterium]